MTPRESVNLIRKRLIKVSKTLTGNQDLNPFIGGISLLLLDNTVFFPGLKLRETVQ